MSSTLRGSLFALAAFGILATHDVLIKYLGGLYSPFQIVFFSVLFGFPFVTFMLLRDASEANLIPRHPWWTAIRTATSVITGVTAFYAFSVLPLAQTYAILFAAPLLITILAIPILGESVGWRRWLAVSVGLGGVLIVLQPTTTSLTLGHISAVVAACSGAFGAVIMRKIGRDERQVVLILYPMMGNFIAMGAAMPFVYRAMPGIDVAALAVIAAFALLGTLFLISAYRLAPAGIVAPMQYSQILWASFFGIVLFGEGLDGPTILGSFVIIASGLFIVLRETRGASVNTPVLRTRSRAGVPTAPRISPFLTREHGGSPLGHDE